MVRRSSANLSLKMSITRNASESPTFCITTVGGRLLATARGASHTTVRRDMTPGFMATELIVWLNKHKIIRPGYTICKR